MLLRREATAAAAASNQTRTIVVGLPIKNKRKRDKSNRTLLICSEETLELIRFLNWICSMPYLFFSKPMRSFSKIFPRFLIYWRDLVVGGCTVGNSIPKSSLLPIEIKYGNEPWKMMPSFPFY